LNGNLLLYLLLYCFVIVVFFFPREQVLKGIHEEFRLFLPHPFDLPQKCT